MRSLETIKHEEQREELRILRAENEKLKNDYTRLLTFVATLQYADAHCCITGECNDYDVEACLESLSDKLREIARGAIDCIVGEKDDKS